MRLRPLTIALTVLATGLAAAPAQAQRHPAKRSACSAKAPHKCHRSRKHRATHQVTVQPSTVAAPQQAAQAPATPNRPSTCTDTNVTPNSGNLEAIRASTTCLVNNIRIAHGLVPLQRNSKLDSAAQPYATLMVVDDFFSHFTPTGGTPQLRILATGYVPALFSSYAFGENIAWATSYLSTPASIVDAWVHSPEHLANILTAAFRETGMGVAPAVPPSLSGGVAGGTYVQDFGVVNP